MLGCTGNDGLRSEPILYNVTGKSFMHGAGLMRRVLIPRRGRGHGLYP
jgi:hypothetical protein